MLTRAGEHGEGVGIILTRRIVYFVWIGVPVARSSANCSRAFIIGAHSARVFRESPIPPWISLRLTALDNPSDYLVVFTIPALLRTGTAYIMTSNASRSMKT